MKRVVISLLVLCCTLHLNAQQRKDRRAIEKLFHAYNACESGTEAFQYIDSSYTAFYDSLLYLIRYADSATLKTCNIQQQAWTLFIRGFNEHDSVRGMDAKQLYMYAFDKAIDPDYPNQKYHFYRRHLQMAGDSAKIRWWVNRRPTPNFEHYYRYNDGWRIGMAQRLYRWLQQTEAYIKEQNMTEDEYLIEEYFKSAYYYQCVDVWQPIN